MPLRSTVLLSALMLVLGVSAALGQATSPPPFSVYLARDDGAGRPGDEVRGFSVTDVPIWCVVLLDSPRAATVRMNFVAVNVPGVRPDTRVVSTSFTTTDTQNRVNFSGRPDGQWVPGLYRVDVSIEGLPTSTIEFEIKGRPVAVNNFVVKTSPAKTPPVKRRPTRRP